MGNSNNTKTIDNSLDIIKLLASMAIVMLHSFIEHKSFMDLYGAQFLTRWAVGFFFIEAGYFMKDTFKGLVRYLLSILKVYVAWTVFYALYLGADIWSVRNFLSAIRSGIIMPFWYFSTLLLAYTFVWLLYYFIKDFRIILVITGIMFFVALMGCTWINVGIFKSFMDKYFFVWHERLMGVHSTREGLFNASLYLALGHYFRRIEIKEDKLKFPIRCFAGFFALYIIEIICVVYFGLGELDVMLTSPFLCSFLLLIGISVPFDKEKALVFRKMSLYVFLVHCFFLNEYQKVIKSQWIVFFCTLISSLLFAYLFGVLIYPKIKVFLNNIIRTERLHKH